MGMMGGTGSCYNHDDAKIASAASELAQRAAIIEIGLNAKVQKIVAGKEPAEPAQLLPLVDAVLSLEDKGRLVMQTASPWARGWSES